MEYFEPDFLDFFRELETNNNKAWFDEHRKRYESKVKEPTRRLVSDLVNSIQALEPDFNLEPKNAVFRINRDIRFSKDKSPYQTHSSFILSPRGRADKTEPGLYVHFSSKETYIAGGAYFLEPKVLKNVRWFIADHLEEFQRLLKSPDFESSFGKILGEVSKKLDADLTSVAQKEPLLYNKQFYFWKVLPDETVLRPDLCEMIVQYYRIALPFNRFLRDAVRSA